MADKINSEFDTKMVENLALAEEAGEVSKCIIVDGKIEPCGDLMEVIDNEESIRVSELADGREYICFDNTGLIISTCPFCATTLFKEGDL